jgi:hypothetical protein
MTKLILLPLLFVSATAFSQTKIDTLTDETIIKLTKNKLPESVITQKINQSICNFDVSVDDLIKLKENNVSDNVINLMINKQGKSDAITNAAVKNNTNDKNFIFTESGIYFLKNGTYTNLDPTIVSSTGPKAGVFNIKYKSQIEGGEANYKLDSKRPDFYFNFEPIKKSLNDANANSSSTTKDNYLDQLFSKMGNGYSSTTYQAVSPNDFKLIKLDKSKSKREFVSGKISSFGSDMSIGSKNIVNFKYEKISASTYKIKFDKDLEAGEYCFLYLGNNNNVQYMQVYGQNNLKVFDFGVK